MKKLSFILLFIPICMLFVGCSYHSKNLPVGSIYENTDPGKIVIVEKTPNKSYESIGKVHSHCRWNWFFGWAGCGENKMKIILKEEAAKLGADAIIDVKRESFSQYEWTDVHYHATAIRWN